MPRKKAPLEVIGEKPSLASLKPDSKVTAAAKKRAVNRIDAASSTKTSPLRIKQISDTLKKRNLSIQSLKMNLSPKDTPKEIAPKLTVSNSKKEIKKVTTTESAKSISIGSKKTKKETVLPKSVPQVVAENKSESQKSPYSFFVSKKQPRSNLDELRPRDPIVRLPENMSIRAREKALVILQSFAEDFELPAEKISLISGVCFLVLGSYLALSFTGYMPGSSNQLAQIQSAINSATTSNLTATGNTTIAQIDPVFHIIDQVPPQLTATAVFTFSISNAKNVSVRMFSLDTGKETSLNVEQLTQDTYRYKIEADKTASGHYTVKVFADNVITNTKYNYVIGDFVIPAPVAQTVTATTTTATRTRTASSTSNTTSGTGTGTSNTAAGTVPPASNASTTTQLPKATDYKIRLEGQAELVDKSVFKIFAPADTKTLELYIRPVNSISSRYLGMPEKQSDAWYYFIDTKNIPNGYYEIFARSRINDVFVQSNSLSVKINNPASDVLNEPIPVVADTTQTTTEPKTVAVESPKGDSPNTKTADTINKTTSAAEQSVRTFADSSFDESSSTSGVLRSSSDEINSVFVSYRSELDDILKRYAVARQSGDQKMLRAADEEFAKLREKILTDLLADPVHNSLADNVGLEFDARLIALKKRIDTFEKLRHSAGVEDIGVDSDGDGISDYDERNLYHTDGHSVDTDGDGFDDGIEIMHGYDPRSPKGEVPIAYEMPQDTVGLDDPTALRIETVIPSVKQVSDDTKVVQSEIRGKGLPNSFVTLYIFSTPTVVTVKTDNDGSFVYTFEKELDDGQHEVFVAITDNAGAIVAQSSPFKFVKQAEAFTPVDGNEKANTVTLADFKQFELYKTVFGLGILAFGIILIMLGFNLRGNRKSGINDIETA